MMNRSLTPNEIAETFLSLLCTSIDESRITVKHIKWEYLDKTDTSSPVIFSIIYTHNNCDNAGKNGESNTM